ncbi:DgyrCDS1518 [Dimorphilus gyrociliatus]|uniref:Cysteine-rich protein 1 n=1 Tax=Dimorphilus gyrociliatus TaxID=2664684 RepID=A0A7I8V7S3_9ANNE|nr:DgyrCDS1518 [Dimorphilus gyrociliatus]
MWPMSGDKCLLAGPRYDEGYLRPLGSRNRIAESVISHSQAPSVFESVSQVGADYRHYDDNRQRRYHVREDVNEGGRFRPRAQSEDTLGELPKKFQEEENVARMNEMNNLKSQNIEDDACSNNSDETFSTELIDRKLQKGGVQVIQMNPSGQLSRTTVQSVQQPQPVQQPPQPQQVVQNPPQIVKGELVPPNQAYVPKEKLARQISSEEPKSPITVVRNVPEEEPEERPVRHQQPPQPQVDQSPAYENINNPKRDKQYSKVDNWLRDQEENGPKGEGSPKPAAPPKPAPRRTAPITTTAPKPKPPIAAKPVLNSPARNAKNAHREIQAPVEQPRHPAVSHLQTSTDNMSVSSDDTCADLEHQTAAQFEKSAENNFIVRMADGQLRDINHLQSQPQQHTIHERTRPAKTPSPTYQEEPKRPYQSQPQQQFQQQLPRKTPSPELQQKQQQQQQQYYQQTQESDDTRYYREQSNQPNVQQHFTQPQQMQQSPRFNKQRPQVPQRSSSLSSLSGNGELEHDRSRNGTRRISERDDRLQRDVEWGPIGRVIVSVVGGNACGVFVRKAEIEAAEAGLREGDEILAVNDKRVKGVSTLEDVCMMLSAAQNIITKLTVAHKREAYESVLRSTGGDNFYVRANFSVEKPSQGELHIKSGDIFHVTDTMPGGEFGAWRATKENGASTETLPGFIPNNSRAEQIALTQKLSERKTRPTERMGFIRRSIRKSKSADRSHKDKISEPEITERPVAYERVTEIVARVPRPVILLGPFAGAVRQMLLNDPKFGEADGPVEMEDCNPSLLPIRSCMAKQKHCVLILTPKSTKYLIEETDVQPIVIFLKVTKQLAKPLKAKLAPKLEKKPGQIYDESVGFEKKFSTLFSDIVEYLPSVDQFLNFLNQAISKKQQEKKWVRVDELPKDDSDSSMLDRTHDESSMDYDARLMKKSQSFAHPEEEARSTPTRSYSSSNVLEDSRKETAVAYEQSSTQQRMIQDSMMIARQQQQQQAAMQQMRQQQVQQDQLRHIQPVAASGEGDIIGYVSKPNARPQFPTTNVRPYRNQHPQQMHQPQMQQHQPQMLQHQPQMQQHQPQMQQHQPQMQQHQPQMQQHQPQMQQHQPQMQQHQPQMQQHQPQMQQHQPQMQQHQPQMQQHQPQMQEHQPQMQQNYPSHGPSQTQTSNQPHRMMQPPPQPPQHPQQFRPRMNQQTQDIQARYRQTRPQMAPVGGPTQVVMYLQKTSNLDQLLSVPDVRKAFTSTRSRKPLEDLTIRCALSVLLSSTTLTDHEDEVYCRSCYNKNFGASGFGYGLTTSFKRDESQANNRTRKTSVEAKIDINYDNPDNCPKCGKKVFFAEQVQALRRKFHKLCFKCSVCNKLLQPGACSEHDENLYCKNCYGKNFGPKGFRSFVVNTEDTTSALSAPFNNNGPASGNGNGNIIESSNGNNNGGAGVHPVNQGREFEDELTFDLSKNLCEEDDEILEEKGFTVAGSTKLYSAHEYD